MVLKLSKSNKASKRRQTITSAVTRDDMNMVLRMAEIYNTSYDFEAAEWFWGQYKETINYEDLEISLS